MHAETAFLLLFVAATAVAIVARRVRVPYTVALVAAGVVLGALRLFEPPRLTKELLFAIFLPGLLFEAAYHMPFQDYWRNRIAIHSLAIPGVAATIAVVAVILTPVANALHFVQNFDWRHGLVFGALIAATDPIAVVGLFKTLGAPRRLSLLVEGESLLNDGTSIVFFTLVLGIAAGEAVSARDLTIEFARVVGLGALVGAAVGIAVSQVIQRLDDAMIEITLTTIAAYGAFIAAEQLHDSGVIATVVAGMICGNYAARTGMSPSTRVAVETFWEYVAFALNSIVFLLIGFEVRLDALAASWRPILVAYLAVVLGRALVVGLAKGLLARTRERLPRGWARVLSWGGLRGGLSMVLVLSLPQGFPHRELLVTMTFGVVLLSILIQGLTLSPLLRALGIARGHDDLERYALHHGRLQVANAALEELHAMERTRHSPGKVLAELRGEYEGRVREAEEAIDELRLARSEVREHEVLRARRHLLLVEKDQAQRAYHQGIVSPEAYEHLLADIDARLVRLEEDLEGSTPAPAKPVNPAPGSGEGAKE